MMSTPQPTRTEYCSSCRNQGVVFRVCVICAGVPVTASTARRGSLAIPERRCRKLRATRSPPNNARALARTVTMAPPGSAHAPSRACGSRHAPGSSSRNTLAATGRPATTNRPSATKEATAGPSAAAPSNRVVTSSVARSSASAQRTSSRPSGSPNRQHPIDGATRPERDIRGNGDLVLQLAQRVPQLFEGDHLHVATLGLLCHRVELLLRLLAPQAG